MFFTSTRSPNGASEAVDLAIRGTINPGEILILPEPSYVAYLPAVIFAGGEVRSIPTSASDGWRLDTTAVAAAAPGAKALFLGYPANPTGATLDETTRAELARIAVEHDLLVPESLRCVRSWPDESTSFRPKRSSG